MASGLPDYSRGVRPRYGGANIKSGQVAVDASAVTYLTAPWGKGMVYGGNLWLDAALTQANSEVCLIIDDQWVTEISFLRLKDYGITRARTSLVSLNVFNGEDNIYSVGISYGITFEKNFYLGYREAYGRTPTVHYRLYYALI